MAEPTAALLLPAALDRFNLSDQARDLLRSPGVVAIEPGRLPYGRIAWLPGRARTAAARAGASLLERRLPAGVRALAIFHSVQWPVAEALLERLPDCELWYVRFDRYERAYGAGRRRRAVLARLHAEAAERAALLAGVSSELVRLEAEQGREAALAPPAADGFPAPDPTRAVIAACLGHLGWRNDWRLVREVCEAMPELVLLMVGERHDAECRKDPDFRACTELPGIVWLGRQADEQAARLILCADVGIVPFRREPFNDAGLPNRILKYARLGRRTLCPPLAGARTWSRATVECEDAAAWVSALRAEAGRRMTPYPALREWALEQTAVRSNEPLWERLAALGVPGPADSGRSAP